MDLRASHRVRRGITRWISARLTACVSPRVSYGVRRTACDRRLQILLKQRNVARIQLQSPRQNDFHLQKFLPYTFLGWVCLPAINSAFVKVPGAPQRAPACAAACAAEHRVPHCHALCVVRRVSSVVRRASYGVRRASSIVCRLSCVVRRTACGRNGYRSF